MRKRIFLLLLSALLLPGCQKDNLLSDSNEKVDTSSSVVETDDFSLRLLDFSIEGNDNTISLKVSGQFSTDLVLNEPYFVVDNTQENTVDRFTERFTLDEDYHFSLSVDVSTLNKQGAWYNLYFVLNETTNEKIYIQQDLVSEKQLHQTYLWQKDDNTNYEYSLEVWNNNVKLLYNEKDNLQTFYYSMGYEIQSVEGSSQLFFYLKGYSEHENLTLTLSGVETKVVDVETNEDHTFQTYIRVDDILTEKRQYTILVRYTLQSGNSHEEQINDYNLMDTSSVSGICFNYNLYVFKAEVTGKKTYYSLTNCPDSFAMDHVSLKQQNGVQLVFSGTVRIFPSGFYYLHIKNIDNQSDYIVPISPDDISPNGVLSTSIDLTSMPSFSSLSSESTTGQLEIYHDTLLLNQFWPEEWSHRKDELGPVEDLNYRYEISTQTLNGTYGITKARKNAA